jgi:hypothetical protein
MLGASTFDKVLWVVTFLLNTGILALLLYRKSLRVFPFFSLYLLLNLFQGVVLLEAYQAWGFISREAIRIGWSSQGFISLARALAVAEICYLVLAKFTGIWRLAWRLLAAAAALVALYTFALSRGRGTWQFAILNLDRGLELMMATVIVLLFVFVRYYEVVVQSSLRTLAIGFFLYSAFRVLDDSILERWWRPYGPLWNLIGTLTFLASLLLWGWALLQKEQYVALEPELLPEDQYHSLSPAINARLKNLNERLGHFFKAQGERL